MESSAQVTRRQLLSAMAGLGLAGAAGPAAGSAAQAAPGDRLTAQSLLADATMTREQVDHFLDPNQPNSSMFDPELGYRHRACALQNGIDDCWTFYTYEPSGERRRLNYPRRPCRMNTYGNSFTQCSQVSDGETWQEYLAAHFGEPLRNFGSEGHGVYQAYRRMMREEGTAASASHVILNIYNTDHTRSLMAWRWISSPGFRRSLDRTGDRWFHANPWCYVRLDPETGGLMEFENPYPTGESLYQLCDPGHVFDRFHDDFAVQVFLAQRRGQVDKLADLRRFGEMLGLPLDWSTPDAIAQSATELLNTTGFRASMHIVDRARAFAEARGKHLMILLSYTANTVVRTCSGGPRPDQPFLDYLAGSGLPYVDTLQKHVEDFRTFNLSPEAYMRRYYNAHYAPAGNHFFAFAVKDALVEWLDPKPLAYRTGEPTIAAYSGD